MENKYRGIGGCYEVVNGEIVPVLKDKNEPVESSVESSVESIESDTKADKTTQRKK